MIKIFVEGKGDENFIDQFIKFLSSDNNFDSFEIIKLGGWTKIDKAVNLFKENSDSGGRNLVIFDADSPDKNGGVRQRTLQLNSKKGQLDIQFDLFLFPNNSDDGDYESLLEKIINTNHSLLLQCFEQYENCIRSSVDDSGNPRYSLPVRKAKIYSYVDSFPKSRKENERFKKGDFFFENPELWNLNTSYLIPLKDFLINHLSIRP